MPAASLRCIERLIAMLDAHDLPSNFNGVPNEIADAIPFAEDTAPRDYDRDSAARFREALAAMLPVFARFRAGFARQGEPGPFLVGQLRSRGERLFRSEGAAASRRDAGPARPHRARGL